MSASEGALFEEVDALVESTQFSGAVHVTRGDDLLYGRAAGLADRAHLIPNTLDTQFGIASGVKGLTALVVMSLIGEGSLALDTTVRSVLGDMLGEIDRAVTIEQLLTHTSGIGDYLDEDVLDDIDAYVAPLPVHRMATTSDYVVGLDGRPMKSPPGERFSYNNSGFVVLALIAEAVSGSSFYDLVHDRVCVPAGMTSTAFYRNDALPGSVAMGYVPDGEGGWRTNLFHLPIRGSGDGGLTSTVGDFASFWKALFDGRIVPADVVQEVISPRQRDTGGTRLYGLGFWLRGDRQTVQLEGYDAGVSFRSAHDLPTGVTFTVVSNTSEGAWPIVRLLGDLG